MDVCSGRKLRLGVAVGVGLAVSTAWGQTGAAQQAAAQGGTAGTASAAEAEFEVASIKPSDPNARIMMIGLRYTPDGVDATNMTVVNLVRVAYGGSGGQRLGDDSVIGLPDWAKTQRYEVKAKMSDADAVAMKDLSADERQARIGQMLQSLLEDRFKLKMHREEKQVPDFDLVVAKGGPKLQPGGTDPNGPKDRDGNPVKGSFLRMTGMGKVQGQNFGMEQMANFLSQNSVGLGRPVKDKTGLTGKYNFSLNWTPEQGLGATSNGFAPPPPSKDEDGPSIFTALQEQLGLRLQPSTGMIDLVVVDHVERPTED